MSLTCCKTSVLSKNTKSLIMALRFETTRANVKVNKEIWRLSVTVKNANYLKQSVVILTIV